MNPRMLTAPPLAEQVYEAIIDDICNGVIRGGEQLRQEALAERFGVSRQPVQHAMALLKRHGLVRESGKRGLEVVPMDSGFVDHLYDMRLLLDTYAVERSVPGLTEPAVREQAQAILSRGKEAVERRNFADMDTADADFHSFFYTLTDNPFLIDTATLLSQSIRRVMTEVLSRGSVPEWVWDEHERILAAAISGDTKLARRLASQHVEHGRSLMLTAL
ncbi:MAG: GntR family transcriptional regulator [Kineosporiaceae bacterium]|nr:GntR family transcriptional regulator [Aeromicrobium sp.]